MHNVFTVNSMESLRGLSVEDLLNDQSTLEEALEEVESREGFGSSEWNRLSHQFSLVSRALSEKR